MHYILISAKGVGRITVTTLLAELPELGKEDIARPKVGE